jgi:hypothetical protein
VNEINTIILRYPQKPYAVISDVIAREATNYTETNPASKCFKTRAFWDTGAQICAISKRLAQAMGLVQAGTVDAGGFGGDSKETPFYRIDLTLPDSQPFYSLAVVEYAGKPAHDIIIGMNIITAGDFALTREASGTRFTFTMDNK